MVDAVFNIRADFHVFAAPGCAQFLDAGNFLPKPDATRAMDTACHVSRHKRTEILIFNNALAFRVT